MNSLQLKIIRYNIGATDPSQKKDFAAYRWMESFSNGTHWNPNADQAQRLVLQKAKRMGVTLFEAFSNSPPWFMTVSKSSKGNHDKSDDNLAPSEFPAFANYLARVLIEAKVQWNITFSSISPFNEPNSDFWNYHGVAQEGCDMKPINVIRFGPHLKRALQNYQLDNIAITGHEANNLDAAKELVDPLNSLTFLNKVNVHGYFHGQPSALEMNRKRQEVRISILRKSKSRIQRFWMSEVG